MATLHWIGNDGLEDIRLVFATYTPTDNLTRRNDSKEPEIMSVHLPVTDLHLPSLSIKGFRGIADLSVPRLGRVTLIVGKNGVGKTTLLEAVRIYATRGSVSVLSNILENRGEFTWYFDENGNEGSIPDFAALAYGRQPAEGTRVSIGQAGGKKNIDIKFGPEWRRHEASLTEHDGFLDGPLLSIEFEEARRDVLADYLMRSSWSRRLRGRFPALRLPGAVRCGTSGPDLMDNDSLSRFWNRVLLDGNAAKATQALQLIYGDDVDHVAMTVHEKLGSRGPDQRVLVSMKGQKQPVPLTSLGDGAVRIFSAVLGLASNQDGFFVIDEAENGIHHLMQSDFWKMVVQAAVDSNVQVLATTHSWDCVVGFSQAATEMQEVDCLLLRLERCNEQLRIVEYTEEDLQVATRQRIEVR